MNGDFVRRIEHGSRFLWRFDHPSIGDALSSILINQRQSMMTKT